MSYLLDTCVLSEVTKPAPNGAVIAWLSEQADSQLYISVVTVGELRHGVYRLPTSRKKEQLDAWLNTLLNQYDDRILQFDLVTAECWARLTTRAIQEGHTIALADSYIAAVAVRHNLTLVTRNTRDFQAANLSLFNPWG